MMVKPIVGLWASRRVASRRRGSGATGRADFSEGLQARVPLTRLEPLGAGARIRVRPQLKERSCAEPPSWARPSRRARRRLAGGHRCPRLQSPRGAQDPRRPDRRQHRRLRVHRAGRAGQPDGRRQLDPARGAGGRPVLRQARSARPLLRQDRQHRRRRARTSPIAGSSSPKFRNPNSFLYAAPTVDSIDDPDLNFVQTYDLYKETYEGQARRASSGSRATCRSRRPTSGRRRCPTTRASQAARSSALSGGGKAFVGPADDPFFVDLGAVFDGINIDKPGRPTSASATRAAARTTSPATTRTRSCCRCRSPQVTRDGKSVSGATADNAVVGVWATTERRRMHVLRDTARPRRALGAGQPPRQPADQRGHHPDRPEGQVQPHVARRTT